MLNIESLVLDSNTWNHLNVFKLMINIYKNWVLHSNT